MSSSSSTSGASSFEGRSVDHSARHPEWINKCREILISTEQTNIASRVCHWRRIVNEKTDLTNERLNIFIPQNLIPKFEWRVSNLSKYIQFVIQWNGLKMKQIKNSPSNYEEYERKARNWLNGRRAPNYAGTLFPDMIKASEQYAGTVSNHLFGPNNQYSKAYHKILMFGYLHALCSVRISMNDVSKKTFLLCENSIKTNSVTSVLLQQYATDHPFAQYFPSHLKQAADYFQNKFEMDIKRFGNALRLAAGNNMNVNQLNPSITTLPITQSINQLQTATISHINSNNHMSNVNGITGLSINDLNRLNSFGYNNNLQNMNNNNMLSMRQLNGLNRMNMNINAMNGMNGIQFTNGMNGVNMNMNGMNGMNNLNHLNNNRIIITTNNTNNSNVHNNNPNQTNNDHKFDIGGTDNKKHIKSDQALSPLSLTNSHGSNNTCTTNTNTNSINSMLTNNTTNPFHQNHNNINNQNVNIHLPHIPNLTIPPQIPHKNKRNKNANNNNNNNNNVIRISTNDKLIGARINVNGKEESVVSFLNQIVSTCNNQQIFMHRLQNRVQCMEQIIKQIKPQIDPNDQNINGNGALQPLPRVQEIEAMKSNNSSQSLPSLIKSHSNNNNNKSSSSSPPQQQQQQQHLQFIINPQIPQAPQIQFQQIQTQQIQPIHVQQIQSRSQSGSMPQQQFVLNSGAASLPNIIANIPVSNRKNVNSRNKKGETNVKFSNMNENKKRNKSNRELMDDDLNNAAALLASLRHKMTPPKLEQKNSNNSNVIKRQRDRNNNQNNNIASDNNNNNNNSNSPPTKKRKIEGKNASNDLQNILFNTKSNQSQS